MSITYENAMETLTAMFSDVDKEVIAMMLQMNAGHMERTVENLLALTSGGGGAAAGGANNTNPRPVSTPAPVSAPRSSPPPQSYPAHIPQTSPQAISRPPQAYQQPVMGVPVQYAPSYPYQPTQPYQASYAPQPYTPAIPYHLPPPNPGVHGQSDEKRNVYSGGNEEKRSPPPGQSRTSSHGLPDDFLRPPSWYRHQSSAATSVQQSQIDQDAILAEMLQNEDFMQDLAAHPERYRDDAPHSTVSAGSSGGTRRTPHTIDTSGQGSAPVEKQSSTFREKWDRLTSAAKRKLSNLSSRKKDGEKKEPLLSSYQSLPNVEEDRDQGLELNSLDDLKLDNDDDSSSTYQPPSLSSSTPHSSTQNPYAVRPKDGAVEIEMLDSSSFKKQ